MKKVERGSLWFAGSALCLAGIYVAAAPLGCSGQYCAATPDCVTGPLDGGQTGGQGGAAGSAGNGGNAGAGASAGTGGTGGEGGATPDAGGNICGGFAGLTCSSTMYCEYPGNVCGDGDITGTCTPRPQLCNKDCPGACGCDGKFYCNVCEAQRAGTDAVTAACPDASTAHPSR